MKILSYLLGLSLSIIATFSVFTIIINPSVFQNDFSKINQYLPALLIYSLTIVEFVLNFTTKKNIIVVKASIMSSFVSAFAFYTYKYFTTVKKIIFEFQSIDYMIILSITTISFFVIYYLLSIKERKMTEKKYSAEYILFPFLFFIFAFNPFFYLFNNPRLINITELLPLGILSLTAVASFVLIIKAGFQAIAVSLGFLLAFLVTGLFLTAAYFSQNLIGKPVLSLFICVFLIFVYFIIPNIILTEKIRNR